MEKQSGEIPFRMTTLCLFTYHSNCSSCSCHVQKKNTLNSFDMMNDQPNLFPIKKRERRERKIFYYHSFGSIK